MNIKNKIEMATYIAISFLGKPYIWGGDDPIKGFDCSGFVIELLKSVGVLPRSGDWTAQGLYERFAGEGIFDSQRIPAEGYLVFWYLRRNVNKIIHVEYCLNDTFAIGASGGGIDNVTIQDAIDKNAYIKIRPFRSRKNIYGFVDPFKEERR